MNTFVLAAAYRRVGEVLAAAGHADKPYHVSVGVWNHRHGDPHPAYTVTAVMALDAPDACVIAWDRPSFDDALALFAEKLAAWTPRAPLPLSSCAPETLPDVVLPGGGAA